MFESHGLKMVQSNAIVLTLAREFGLMGNSLQEEYFINSLLFSIEDLLPKFIPAVFGMNPEAIAAMPQKTKEFLEVHVPFFLQKVEARFKQYGGKYFIRDNFTLADLIITYMLNNIFRVPSRRETWEQVLLDNAPTLAAHIENIAKNELAGFYANGFINDVPL